MEREDEVVTSNFKFNAVPSIPRRGKEKSIGHMPYDWGRSVLEKTSIASNYIVA